MTQGFIGTIARQAGVPIKTIRYYEEVGLLLKPARTSAGYRLYAPATIDRLRFIKKAQNFGLRLEEIKEILDLVDRSRCPCGHVQRLLHQRLAELREKIEDLRLFVRRIQTALGRGGSQNSKPKGKSLCPTIQGTVTRTGR